MSECPWDSDCSELYYTVFWTLLTASEEHSGPRSLSKDGAHTHTCQHKYALAHPFMWIDLSCFMSAARTLSLVISLVLSVFWIMQVCLHTATCLNTCLMRLLTLGFQQRVCMCVCGFSVLVFWCDSLLMLWMREDRCLYVDVGMVKKKNERQIYLKCYVCLLSYTQ